MIVYEILQRVRPYVGIARCEQLADLGTKDAVIAIQAAKPRVRAGLSLLELDAAL